MRPVWVALVSAFVVALPMTAVAVSEVTVLELIQLSEELAGESVIVEGELVGDYGFRGDGSMWAQLNGDIYATEPIRETGSPSGANIGVGVRMPAELGEMLDPPGGYRLRGPLVRLSGTWKYHDPLRQGESYLEVTAVEVIEPGRQLSEPVNWVSVGVGLGLVVVSLLVWLSGRAETERDPILFGPEG